MAARESISNAYEYEDPPSHGWKYILGIVVIAAAGFAYLHWNPSLLSFLNQNKATSPVQGNSARVTAPTLPRTAEEQPSPATPSTPKDSAPEPAAVTASSPEASEDQPSAATAAPQPVQDRTIMSSGVRPAAVKSTALGAASRVATSTTPPLETLDGGIADLRQAQRYLGSSTGARDSSEAAKFLWKAVRQQNATAAVLLSELYASGDGVSKIVTRHGCCSSQQPSVVLLWPLTNCVRSNCAAVDKNSAAKSKRPQLRGLLLFGLITFATRSFLQLEGLCDSSRQDGSVYRWR